MDDVTPDSIFRIDNSTPSVSSQLVGDNGYMNVSFTEVSPNTYNLVSSVVYTRLSSSFSKNETFITDAVNKEFSSIRTPP